MKLTELPYSIFLDLWSCIPPADIIVCRRLSSEVRDALVQNDLCMRLILVHFPRSLEGRYLRARVQDGQRDGLGSTDWAAVFARVARRYYHLGNAIPGHTEKIPFLSASLRIKPMAQWERYLQLNNTTAPFHYEEPLWTCAAADGLLIYPASVEDGNGLEYRARDLSTGTEVIVPFGTTDRAVRRVRLSHGVLVFEWCDWPYQRHLELADGPLRHTVTAYVVTRTHDINPMVERGSEPDLPFPWLFSLRSEWTIQPNGLDITSADIFYSTHNERHYIIYTWRDQMGELAYEDSLMVWDMGDPSSAATSRPHLIRTMRSDDIGFFGIHQGDRPRLTGLQIDDDTWDERTASPQGHLYVLEEDHRWSRGIHTDTFVKPRLHHVRSTGIPLVGSGPRWEDNCGGDGSDNGSMNFCRRRLSPTPQRGLDADTTRTLPGRAPCWRHDDFPYLTVVEVFDVAAGVRFSPRQCFMLETLSVHMRPKLSVRGIDSPSASLGDDAGTITSDSSSDVSMDDVPPAGNEGPAQSKRRKGGTRTNGPDGVEVQFADGIWTELLGKGYMCGDERWLIGEDTHSHITIVHF